MHLALIYHLNIKLISDFCYPQAALTDVSKRLPCSQEKGLNKQWNRRFWYFSRKTESFKHTFNLYIHCITYLNAVEFSNVYEFCNSGKSTIFFSQQLLISVEKSGRKAACPRSFDIFVMFTSVLHRFPTH